MTDWNPTMRKMYPDWKKRRRAERIKYTNTITGSCPLFRNLCILNRFDSDSVELLCLGDSLQRQYRFIKQGGQFLTLQSLFDQQSFCQLD